MIEGGSTLNDLPPQTFRLCAAQNASFDLDDAMVANERANTSASTPGA
jgi:hypothetical protein